MKVIARLLFVLFLFSFSTLKTQPILEFAFNIGAGGTLAQARDFCHDLTTDDLGNIYITGALSSSTDFNPGEDVNQLTVQGSPNIFVAKYTSSGSFLWGFTIGKHGYPSEGIGIALDAENNIYITGYFSHKNVDFDPSSNTFELSAHSNGRDIFVAKYDTDGNFLSAFNLGGDSIERGVALAVDEQFNIYVTGEFGNNADFDPGPGTSILINDSSYNLFVAKYDSLGAYQWAFGVGAGTHQHQHCRGLVLDSDSNVYVTGGLQGTTADFDPGPDVVIPETNGGGIFLAKYTSEGALDWVHAFSSKGSNRGQGVAIDNQDNVYISGNFRKSIDFDPGIGVNTLTSNGSNDIFVAKYNSSGEHLLSFNIGGTGGDISRDIAVDELYNIYITGFFSDVVDFDPFPLTENVLTSNGKPDVYVAKYDLNGLHQWAFGCGSSNRDEGMGIDLSLQNPVVVGHIQGTNVDFDPGSGTTYLGSSSSSDIDFFVAKYSAISLPGGLLKTSDVDNLLPAEQKIPNSLLEDNSRGKFSLFPNPTHDYIYLSLEGQEYDSSQCVEITIYDLAGSPVLVDTKYMFGNLLNIRQLPSGVYFVKATTAENKSFQVKCFSKF